jgi:hypothetical protein
LWAIETTAFSSSTDADDFIAYLERYPHGVFVPLARNKLKRMGVVVIAPKAPPKPQPAVVPSKPVANYVMPLGIVPVPAYKDIYPIKYYASPRCGPSCGWSCPAAKTWA